MKISELIGYLQEIEDIYEDMEVRIAYQPHYPLQCTIAGVMTEEEVEERIVNGEREGDAKTIAFILEGSPRGYASRKLWEG